MITYTFVEGTENDSDGLQINVFGDGETKVLTIPKPVEMTFEGQQPVIINALVEGDENNGDVAAAFSGTNEITLTFDNPPPVINPATDSPWQVVIAVQYGSL